MSGTGTSEICSELSNREGTLRAQSNALLSSIAALKSQANLQYLQCLNTDNFGGTYPQQPLTSVGVAARITFLASLNPPPQQLIMQYYTLYQTLVTMEGQQAALDQTNAMLASVIQQMIDNGCQI